jgi:hypothetical protein
MHRLTVLVAVAVVAAVACGGSPSSAPSSTVGGRPSDIDSDLPVPSDAVQQSTAGAWRVARTPADVARYYSAAFPEFGWSVEKDSTTSDPQNVEYVVCRKKVWRTVGVLADRNRAGNTLITLNQLSDQHDDCP